MRVCSLVDAGGPDQEASSKKIVVKAVKTKPFDIKKISAWLAKQQKVERIAVGTQFSKGGRPGNVLHYSAGRSFRIP